MKHGLLKFLIFILLIFAFGSFLYQESQDDNSPVAEWKRRLFGSLVTGKENNQADKIYKSERFDNIPYEDFFKPSGKEMLALLQDRYIEYLNKLVVAIREEKAVPVVCILDSKAGYNDIVSGKTNTSIISDFCKEKKVDMVHLTSGVYTNPSYFYKVENTTHINKEGAKYICSQLAAVLEKYPYVKAIYKGDKKSNHTTFADGKSNTDKIMDEGRPGEYRLVINQQGLRMDYNLLQKNKQRVMALGSTEFFFPGLENRQTAFAYLSEKYQNKEFLNAAYPDYCIDDYLSLWNEKAKYSQPDIVLIQAKAEDVLHLFFSHRLRYSRHKDAVKPQQVELDFYEKL